MVKQYYKYNFKITDFENLKKECDKLHKKQVNFMITLNYHTDLKKKFNDYNIKSFKKYSHSTNGKGFEKEMIITNY